MEKKRNHVARNGQQTSDYYSKKNQDVSTKQHYRRRKEQSEYSNSNGNSKQSNKYRNNGNNNNFYDKRPPARKNAQQDERNVASCETARLMEDDYELNSVFNPGSKKQSLNHLLNFHKYTKESDDLPHYRGAFSKHGYRHSRIASSKKYQYRKEQYLQANCQFIVKEDAKFDYRPFTTSPDTLVEWDQVVKVLISSCEEIQCPICLYPPKAAKMTKCGHIYCFSCMLHYLSLSDKTWRKCPICYESVHLNDLKSTTSKHNHTSYKVGDKIAMELMKREKGSLFVNKASEIHNIVAFPSFTDIKDTFTYAKLIMANRNEILKVIEQEKYELDFQLAEDGIDCPESIFVHQALDLLNAKQMEIENEIQNEQHQLKCNNSQMQQVLESSIASENIAMEPMSDLSSTDDGDFCNESVIDEDCDLTVNDIDIVSETSSAVQSKYFYYYQAPNAQNVFLHSINSKMLQLMNGSLENSPQTIHGKIVQIECCTMNEDLRKRLKYLQHLPVSSVFEVIEIEFDQGIISKDVHDLFRDELYFRRKKRQIREREEKKREKVINEINDRQMGKMLKSASANIDICSTAQFPECGILLDDMPALASNSNEPHSSTDHPSSGSLPSFANMLTSPTGRDSEKLWPSLSTNKPSTSSNATNSFFGDGDKKFIHVTGSKAMSTTACDLMKKSQQPLNNNNSTSTREDDYDDDSDVECKAPVYKNNLSDALLNALKTASLNDVKSSGGNGKKKKSKKTLLFSSGMNFN